MYTFGRRRTPLAACVDAAPELAVLGAAVLGERVTQEPAHVHHGAHPALLWSPLNTLLSTVQTYVCAMRLVGVLCA